MKKFICLFSVFLLFLGCDTVKDGPKVTYFKEIKKDYKGSYFALKCFFCDGAYSYMVEHNERGEPVSQDTLLVWTQHFNKDATVYPQAYKSDMIIICHPADAPFKARLKTIYPFHDGKVTIEYMKHGYVAVIRGHMDSKYEISKHYKPFRILKRNE